MIADLAEWAVGYTPSAEDSGLARVALVDTVAVAVAAEHDPIVGLTSGEPTPLRWGATGHVLDFDDVHLPSTTHVSVVCASATLATGGGTREYLAAAGVMARLGSALGWPHYQAGWHATCTAGAPAAAVAAGIAGELDADGLATAMALAVPAAGGVRRAFGTSAKSLQVGFAIDAGVRAARLAAAGAEADSTALDQWFDLVGGGNDVDLAGPAVPGGLAVKLHPCCYALQRPIAAARALLDRDVEPANVERIVVSTTEGAMAPLIHHDPRTGLAGKFSMEYAVATTLLDGFPDIASFSDAAVTRPRARQLLDKIELNIHDGGSDILAGDVTITATLRDGSNEQVSLAVPPGHPDSPATREDLVAKIEDCMGYERAKQLLTADWPTAAGMLRF